MTVMEKSSNRDLSRFFDAWVFGEQIPTVRFSYRTNGTTLVLRLEQVGAPMPVPIGVRLQYRSGKTDTVIVQADGQVTEHTVQLTEPLRTATANADFGALATIVR
jgi:aminopeptidase N